jgi:glycosyltransferase involved in cell wall biosynthesis
MPEAKHAEIRTSPRLTRCTALQNGGTAAHEQGERCAARSEAPAANVATVLPVEDRHCIAWRGRADTTRARAVVRRVHDVEGMTVSVVIPTYNRAHTVLDAVRSVLRQTYRDLELIVVDDGSTDDTAPRLAAERDPRVGVIMGHHAGVSAARNLGVSKASGELIAFLDSDDLWHPDKLAAEVDFLTRHPEVHAVFTDLEKRHGDRVYPSFMRQTAVFSRRLAHAAYPDGLIIEARDMRLCLLEEVPIKPSALTLRRTAFDAAGGFDETWSSSEDWEFLLRLARDHRFAYLDRPLAVLTISPDSLHILDQSRGERAMIRLLVRERAALGDDAEALAAVGRGLVSRIKHFAWHHADAGSPRRAAAVFLRGFVLTGDVGLLARAIAVWLPGLITRATSRPARRAFARS